MKLGVDVFSLRFNDWNAFELLEYAHRVGLDVVHFSDMSSFESTETGFLRNVKRRADELGIGIEVGMDSICPTSTRFAPERGTVTEQLTEMLNVAAELGSPALRCYLGSMDDRQSELPMDAHCVAVVANLREIRSLARDLNVKIAIENHAGDLQGGELARLIESAGPDFVGACIDAGNPLWVAESPFVTLEKLAPYVLMSHVRDSAVWPHPDGAAVQWVAMGEGNIDIEAWSQAYIAACPNTNFTLEIITSIAPRVVNFMSEGFWEVFPETLASEFTRFLKLVQAGRPYTAPVLTANWGAMLPEVRQAIALQQQDKLEKSVRYCRDVLGVGE
jgi:sugar phosphate isomerase/epimerase